MHPAVVGHRVTIDTLNGAIEASDAVEDDDPDSPVEAFEQSGNVAVIVAFWKNV